MFLDGFQIFDADSLNFIHPAGHYVDIQKILQTQFKGNKMPPNIGGSIIPLKIHQFYINVSTSENMIH